MPVLATRMIKAAVLMLASLQLMACATQSASPHKVEQKFGPFEQSVGPDGVKQSAGGCGQRVNDNTVEQGCGH